METAKALNVPDERYEFQVLYGMAEPVRKGLMKVAKRVRLYAPYGDLLPRHGLSGAPPARKHGQRILPAPVLCRGGPRWSALMENPVATVEREKAQRRPEAQTGGQGSHPASRTSPSPISPRRPYAGPFVDALAVVRTQLGKEYPLVIGGQEVRTADTLQSVNPANPERSHRHHLPGFHQGNRSGHRSRKKGPLRPGKALSPEERAGYLLKAAEIARTEIFTLCAWQTLEVGKQYDQAQADVAEAIDFMEY